jgi:hypothetical protein
LPQPSVNHVVQRAEITAQVGNRLSDHRDVLPMKSADASMKAAAEPALVILPNAAAAGAACVERFESCRFGNACRPPKSHAPRHQSDLCRESALG